MDFEATLLIVHDTNKLRREFPQQIFVSNVLHNEPNTVRLLGERDIPFTAVRKYSGMYLSEAEYAEARGEKAA